MKLELSTESVDLMPDPSTPFASFGQHGLWMVAELEGASAAYNESLAFVLDSRLSYCDLTEAVERVVTRHEALRTAFKQAPSGDLLRSVTDQPRVEWQQINVGQADDVHSILAIAAQVPFDLSQGPLIRANYLQRDLEPAILQIIAHHMVLDGWSRQILSRELELACAEKLGVTSTVHWAVPPPFSDFVAFEREFLSPEQVEADASYWKDQLSGVKELLAFPYERPRPPQRTFSGGSVSGHVPSSLANKLRGLSRANGVTLFSTLLAGFALVVSRYSGETDLPVGVPVANRLRPQDEMAIGHFVNTLVIRSVIAEDMPFNELSRQISDTVASGLEHSAFPFAKVVELLRPARSLAHNPIYQVGFEYHRDFDKHGAARLGILPSFPHSTQTAKNDFTLFAEDDGEGVVLRLEYSSDLLGASAAKRLLESVENALFAVSTNPTIKVGQIPLLSTTERHRVLLDWNSTDQTFPPPRPLYDYFEERADLRPGATAVRCGSSELTYAQLRQEVELMAQRLLRAGVGSGDRVCLSLDRSITMIVGLLAILRCGAAFVPIDPRSPGTRARAIASDCSAAAVLVSAETKTAFEEWPSAIIQVDGDAQDTNGELPSRAINQSVEDTAYIIYTSGTTGTPKGVAVRHRNIANTLQDIAARYPVLEGDRYLFNLNYVFDASVIELFSWFFGNGALVILEPGLESSPDLLSEVLVREKITHVIFPTALLGPFVDEVENHPAFFSEHSLKFVYAGGAALSSYVARRAHRVLSPAVFENHYGPTEAAILATAYTVTGSETGQTIPIGRPISNTRAYVLNEMLEPAPVGVTGELFLGGAGVAAGYINDPELTSARFIPDPWCPDQHLYRTGDHCAWLPDGTLSFKGRIDLQIKIRGMRVELGEIEHALLSLPGIRQAAVVDVQAEDDSARLAAFVVWAPGVEGASEYPQSSDIIAQLKTLLPSHMVPASLQIMEALPVTRSGKVDRRILTEAAAIAPSTDVSPKSSPAWTSTEAALVEIWSSVLRCTVNTVDNFFELGGDSILAIQVASRARRIGLVISARDIFRYQSISELAAAAGMTASWEPVTKTEEEWRLLPIQKRFFDWSLPDSNRFDQSVIVSVPDGLELEFLLAWLDSLVRRHPALRTRFSRGKTSGLATVVNPDSCRTCFRLEESYHPSELNIKGALETARSLLNIESGPLFVATVLRESEEHAARLLLTSHHLAVDGVSWRIILDELRIAFDQWSEGREIDLGSPPQSAVDWVRLLKTFPEDQLDHDRAYWRRQLKPVGATTTDTPVGGDDDADIVRFTHEFDNRTTRAILDASRLQSDPRTADFVTAIVLWSLGLCGIQGEISVALEGHGREAGGTSLQIPSGFDISQTVGWFTSYYPVAFHVPNPSSADVLEHLDSSRQRAAEIPSRGLSYDILRYLHEDAELRDRETTSKPYVLLNFLGNIEDAASSFRRLDSIVLTEADDDAPVHHVVEINGHIAAGRLVFRIALQSGRFPQTAERFQSALSEAADLIADKWTSAPDSRSTPAESARHPNQLTTADPLGDITFPMTGLQRGLLFESMLKKNQTAYVNQLFFETGQPFDVTAFEEAWAALFLRHDALRTAFGALDQEMPLQVAFSDVRPEFRHLDFTHLAKDVETAEFEALRNSERARPLDLEAAPLMRLVLVKCPDQRHRFLWTCHHAILDGWSISILWRELELIYRSLVSGKVLVLPEPAPYGPYAEWLSNQNKQAARAFWQEELGDFTGDRIEPGRIVSSSQTRNVRTTITLSKELSAAIYAGCRRLRVTPATFFQAVWALTLHDHGSGTDLVFGNTVSGRSADIPGVENIVGLLIATVPSRIKIDGDQTISAWLQNIQLRHIEREHFSYLDLVEIQKCSSIGSRADLFDTLLVYENYPQNLFGADATSTFACSFDENTHYELGLIIIPGAQFRLDIEFNPGRYSEKEVAAMADTITTNISAISQGSTSTKLRDVGSDGQPKAPLPTADLSMVSRQGDLPLGRLIVHELVEDWADREPSREAVVCRDRSYTYAELNASANRLAHVLLERGVGPDTCVGVQLQRDERLLISILAIWKAGAAYVPLDPALPQQRIHEMLGICEAAVVISDQSTKTSSLRTETLDFDAALAAQDGRSENPNINVSSSDLAYVLFTSGSTGSPKGAMVEHIGVLNNILNKVRDFEVDAESRVAQIASQSFDISIWQMFIGLTQGGQTVIFDDRAIKDVPKLWRDLETRGITTLEVVPTYLMLLVEHLDQIGSNKDSNSLTHLILTGEAADARYMMRWRDHFPDVTIANAYGPTEASDDITHYLIPSGHDIVSPVPIGHVLSNFDIYIVDENLQPVPLGEKGEIVVTGVGIGRGYKNMPAQTHAAFLASPFPDRHRGRLYKTGDLGEMRADGLIYFHGRKDKQVKVRGYRIELEEIEHHLCQCSSVRQAAVVNVAEDGEEAALCAFIVPTSEVPESKVTAELKDRVPEYMVPTELRFVEVLPELESGKIDRKTLKEGFARPASGEAISPRTDVEKRLAEIWVEVLSLDVVDIHTSFFDLGGDSFKAIRMSAKFGAPLEVADIYDFETVAAIAEAMVARTDGPTGVLVPVSGDLKRSDAIIVAVANSGGDPISFREVGHALQEANASLTLVAVKLPRLPVADDSETLAEIARLTEQVCNEIQEASDLPVIVLAQCNGSALGISIARELAARGVQVPAICIGGALIRDELSPADSRTDQEILEFLGGIGSTLPSDPAEAAFFLHDFRYDSRFANAYYNQLLQQRHSGDLKPLPSHLVCIVGTRDPLVDGYETKFRRWNEIASSTSLVEYSGHGHYLLRDCPASIAHTLIETWARLSDEISEGGR